MPKQHTIFNPMTDFFQKSFPTGFTLIKSNPLSRIILSCSSFYFYLNDLGIIILKSLAIAFCRHVIFCKPFAISLA